MSKWLPKYGVFLHHPVQKGKVCQQPLNGKNAEYKVYCCASRVTSTLNHSHYVIEYSPLTTGTSVKSCSGKVLLGKLFIHQL